VRRATRDERSHEHETYEALLFHDHPLFVER
jgi:hypothetical protein